MKILGICGSPRKGNSEYMLRTFLEEAKKKHTVEIVLLKDEKLSLCQGCQTCDKTGYCILRDNMAKVFTKMVNADLIVFSFPIYFDSFPAIMKNLIDRTTGGKYLKLKNKKFIFLAVGALKGKEAKPGKKMVLTYMKDLIEVYSFKLEGYFFAQAEKPEEIKNSPEQLEKIKELARKI